MTYTPITEEVVTDYLKRCALVLPNGEDTLDIETYTDSWVDFEVKEAVTEEQERIIGLLSNPAHHRIGYLNAHLDCYTCKLIALIKGEK